jgi:hypothetical protein
MNYLKNSIADLVIGASICVKVLGAVGAQIKKAFPALQNFFQLIETAGQSPFGQLLRSNSVP